MGTIDSSNTNERVDDVGVVLVQAVDSVHSGRVVDDAESGTVNIGVNGRSGEATTVVVPSMGTTGINGASG